MVMSLSATQEQMLQDIASGKQALWYVTMDLGPYAHLQVTDYTAASGDAFTLDVTHSGGTITETFTESSEFSVGADNAATATAIAAAINSTATINDRVSAYARGAMVVIHGKGVSSRIQNTSPATKIRITESSDAWTEPYDPVDRTYRFASSNFSRVAADAAVQVACEIASVESISSEVDPMSRDFSIGDLTITIADGGQRSVFRQLVKGCYPRGKFVAIKMLCEGYQISDAIDVGAGLIDEVMGKPSSIEIRCREIPSILETARFDNRLAPVTGISVTDYTAISGVTVTIGIEHADGAVEITLEEGVDFTAAISNAATIYSLIDAINTEGTSEFNTRAGAFWDRVGSATNAGLVILPIPPPGETPVSVSDRPFRAVCSVESGASGIEVTTWAGGYTSTGSGWYMTPPFPGVQNMHPIELNRELYRAAGLDASLVDESSFARATYSTLSHWAISATDESAYRGGPGVSSNNLWESSEEGEAMMAIDVQKEISKLTQGGVVAKEDGSLSFVRRDPAAAVDRVITEADYDEIVVEEMYANTVNRVHIYGSAWGEQSNARVHMITLQDNLSRAVHSYVRDVNPQDMEVESRLLGTYTQWLGTTLDESGTSMNVAGAWRAGFSGVRQQESGTTWTQASGDDISAGTRDVYLLLWSPESGDREIVKVSAVTTSGPVSDLGLQHPPSSTNYVLRHTRNQSNLEERRVLRMFDQFSFTLSERGLYGTATDSAGTEGVNWANLVLFGNTTLACDITIAVEMAKHFMEFAYGVPILSFRTSMKHWDLQIGDVLRIENTYYLDTYMDGIQPSDTNTTWEVVSKEMEWPHVKFKVARLRAEFWPGSDHWDWRAPVGVFPDGQSTGGGSASDPITDNSLAIVTDSALATLYR